MVGAIEADWEWILIDCTLNLVKWREYFEPKSNSVDGAELKKIQ